jgi:PAS domain S-box-containing protein
MHAQLPDRGRRAPETGEDQDDSAEPKAAPPGDGYHFRDVLELNPDAILIRIGPSIVFANHAATRMLGATSPDELIGRDSISLHHEKDHERVHDARYQITVRKRADRLIETTMLRFDGASFDAESFGLAVTWKSQPAVMITIRDISERKNAERRLRQNEARYRKLFEILPDGICVLLAGTIAFANPAAARMFGHREAGDLAGHREEDLYAPGEHERIPGAEQVCARSNGTTFRAHVTRSPMTWDGGEARLLIIQDMTERLRAAEDHRRYLATARQKAEVEQALAKERELNGLQRQFVSMVSHEFRTPLGIIDGNAHRMIRRASQLAPGQISEAMGKVRVAVQRMIGLIESVLSVARLEAGQIDFVPGVVDLGALLSEVALSHAELWPHHRIDVEVGGLTRDCVGDETLLRQVIANLLSNALKYSDTGMTVRIRAWQDGTNSFVELKDEGFGIKPEELERLFECFFRASSSTGIVGTGIGLHLVKHLVDLHHGTIDVSSVEAQGTTFTVTLPG